MQTASVFSSRVLLCDTDATQHTMSTPFMAMVQTKNSQVMQPIKLSIKASPPSEAGIKATPVVAEGALIST